MPLQKILRFGLLFCARIAGAASLFAANLLIVHYLGFESLATYAVFVSLVSILAVIISAGFTAIAPIFVAEYSKKKQPELLTGFARTALKHGGTLFGALCLGMVGLILFENEVPAVGNIEVAVAVLAAAGASAILGFNSAVLVGMKKQVSALIPETFLRPVAFTVLSGIALAAGLTTEINTVLWIYVFSIWLIFGFVLFRDRKVRARIFTPKLMKEPSRWRNAALPWMGISLLWDFMIDLMLLLTSVMAGSIEIAILHICFRYRVLAGFGMRTIHTLMMPEITEHTVTGNMKVVRRKLYQLNLASLGYALLVMLGFAVLGQWLLGIFSDEAITAVPVLLIVSATMVIRAIFGPALLVLAIHNHHMMTLLVSLVAMACAIVFIAVSFTTLGILATAIGYTGANLFISTALWYIAKKKTNIDCSLFANLKLRKISMGFTQKHLIFGLRRLFG